MYIARFKRGQVGLGHGFGDFPDIANGADGFHGYSWTSDSNSSTVISMWEAS
jgi:hypothetical protein